MVQIKRNSSVRRVRQTGGAEVLWRQGKQGPFNLTASPLNRDRRRVGAADLGSDVDDRVDLLAPSRDRHLAQLRVDVIGFDRLAVKRIGVAQLAELVVGFSDVHLDRQPETIVFDPGFA